MKSLIVAVVLALSSTAMAELSPEMRNIIEKLDSECAGNDNGFIGKYDVKKFRSKAVLKELNADTDGECVSNVSTSKAEAISNLKYVLFSKKSYENSCVREALSDDEQAKLAALIDDPTNRAVYSKEWDGDSGDSEYYTYANYDIYRADGTLISIVFNHTD